LYAPWHLVEYYRYLRFFSNGTVIFFTSAEEPKSAVTKLKIPLTSNEQTILKGTWSLNVSKVVIVLRRVVYRTNVGKYSRRQTNKPNDTTNNIDKEHIFRMVSSLLVNSFNLIFIMIINFCFEGIRAKLE
jgi:hypothetical protein